MAKQIEFLQWPKLDEIIQIGQGPNEPRSQNRQNEKTFKTVQFVKVAQNSLHFSVVKLLGQFPRFLKGQNIKISI